MFKRSLLSLALTGALLSAPTMAMETRTNQFWWPDQLNLAPLRDHGPQSNPYGEDFDYTAAFEALDLDAVKKDIDTVLTTSQPWWPADFGNYVPSSSVWRGTQQAHTVFTMAAEVQVEASNALTRLTAGRITVTSTKHAVFFGQ